VAAAGIHAFSLLNAATDSSETAYVAISRVELVSCLQRIKAHLRLVVVKQHKDRHS
jgi:hypothetical protein